MTSFKMIKMNGLASTLRLAELDRKLVCRRCSLVMHDYEEHAGHGEFHHTTNGCVNSGKGFSLAPEHAKEVAPFERKRVRRAGRRAGAHV